MSGHFLLVRERISLEVISQSHKNEVSILQDFIDLKTRKTELVDLGLVWQLNNIIKAQALSIILFFLLRCVMSSLQNGSCHSASHHIFTQRPS